MPKASSCMFVLPRTTAPASTSFWTVGAFSFGTKPRSAGVAAVLGRPATCVLSLTTSGTPCSTPTVLRATMSASARRAAAIAPARSSVMYALRPGFASARAMYAWVSSALVTWPSRISFAASERLSWVRSAGRWRVLAQPEAASTVVRIATAERRRMTVSFSLVGAEGVSPHHARQPQREPRESDQDGEAKDVGPHERQHAAENGRRAHLGKQRPEHEHVHADRRADESDLDHAHDDDSEPDRVETQMHDDREEHRDRQQDHRQLLHRGAEEDVDSADRGDHHRRAHVEAGDPALEIAGHRGDVDELGEDQGADQDQE